MGGTNMHLAIEIATVYAIYLFGTSLLIWRFGSRDRGPSIVVAAVVPALYVAAFAELAWLASLGRSPAIGPCPEGLSDAELAVERQRQKMFGGRALEPHFASDWQRLYAKTVENEAARVQSFARRVLTVS